MKKLKILDASFAHSKLGFCSDFQETKKFVWSRENLDINDIVIVTDFYLKIQEKKISKKIAWLIEPKCVLPQNYELIEKIAENFDFVLTHEKELLDLGKNYHFVPFGCCWIKKEDHRIYGKNKLISMISSDKNFTEGHKLRKKIINKLDKKIDLFGKGHNYLDYKLDGLRDYKFSIVVENCKRDYWFTEKLIDCFVTGTIPIYWGCPSISKFFNADGIISFNNIEELDQIIDSIFNGKLQINEDVIKENFDLSKSYLLPDEHVYDFVNKNYKLL